MAETGFGSPTYTPSPVINDAGFGSPFDGFNIGRDTGIGSHFDPSLLPASLEGGDTFLIGDDGGIRLDISGVWFLESGQATPSVATNFTVKFTHTVSASVTYAMGGYLSNGVQGQVYTNLDQTIIHAYVPPLAHGVYDLTIMWAGQSLTIDDAFEVTTRTRASCAYSMRQYLPAFMKRGAVNMADDSLPATPLYGVIEALTRSAGEMVQRLVSKPVTLSTAVWSEGDASLSVESTVGFPEAGSLHLGDIKLKYAGKTKNTFIGLSYLYGKTTSSINAKTKVEPYVDPLE